MREYETRSIEFVSSANNRIRTRRNRIVFLWVLFTLLGRLGLAADTTPHCLEGLDPTCVPDFQTGVVRCVQGGEVKEYASISSYCLNCHATSRTMPFTHPHDISYPVSRLEFRARDLLHERITLTAGNLTCASCHSGADAEMRITAEHSGRDHICGHCHLTGLECPGKTVDSKSVCFPGKLNGALRCVWRDSTVSYTNSSEFCVGCHGSIRSMAATHPIEVEYPQKRRGFTRVSDLDPEIKLDDGRITCESCHAKLDEGMQLCMHCHPR